MILKDRSGTKSAFFSANVNVLNRIKNNTIKNGLSNLFWSHFVTSVELLPNLMAGSFFAFRKRFHQFVKDCRPIICALIADTKHKLWLKLYRIPAPILPKDIAPKPLMKWVWVAERIP